MYKAHRFSVCDIGFYIGVIVIVWLAICINSTQSSDELGTQKTATVAETSGDQFDNPESVIKTFVSELEQLVDKKGTISPASLNNQLGAAKTCNVDIMAEPTQRLPADVIYTQARAGVVIIGAIPKPIIHIALNLFSPVDL